MNNYTNTLNLPCPIIRQLSTLIYTFAGSFIGMSKLLKVLNWITWIGTRHQIKEFYVNITAICSCAISHPAT